MPYRVSCFLFLLAIFLGPVIGGFAAPYISSILDLSEQQSADLPIFLVIVDVYSILLSVLYGVAISLVSFVESNKIVFSAGTSSRLATNLVDVWSIWEPSSLP